MHAGATDRLPAFMPPSITCHGHIHHDLLPTVQPTQSCPAISSHPPLGTPSRAIPPLNVTDEKNPYSSVHVTELANECASPTLSVLSESSSSSSPTMCASSHEIVPQSAPNSPNIHPIPNRIRSIPSASPLPVSTTHRRSTSCSTTRSGHASSRLSSLHSRPMATNISLPPSVSSRRVPEKRENLIALHREACRIFQNEDISKWNRSEHHPISSPTSISTAYFSPNGGNTPSDPGSPVASPVIHPQPDRSIDRESSLDIRSGHARMASHISAGSDVPHSRQASMTVIDWTSPSTRKREYEKIDRANRGFRGLWKRVAPRWFQPGDNRTPFFEEGKNGKANREGSVRRFRMDIQEDPSSESGLDGPRPSVERQWKRAGIDGSAARKRSRWACGPRSK